MGSYGVEAGVFGESEMYKRESGNKGDRKGSSWEMREVDERVGWE